MKCQLPYASALLIIAAGAAAMAIVAQAPAAPTCVNLGTSCPHCQCPGNVQIEDTPPIQIQPQYPCFCVPGYFPHGYRYHL